MNCCSNPRFIGCFDSCFSVNTGLTAPQTGEYIISSQWLQGLNKQTISLTIGQEIDIPNIYNEFSQILVSIELPDGEIFTDGGNDCFIFKIIPNIVR